MAHQKHGAYVEEVALVLFQPRFEEAGNNSVKPQTPQIKIIIPTVEYGGGSIIVWGWITISGIGPENLPLMSAGTESISDDTRINRTVRVNMKPKTRKKE